MKMTCEKNCETWMRVFSNNLFCEEFERYHLIGVGITDPISHCPWCGFELIDEEVILKEEFWNDTWLKHTAHTAINKKELLDLLFSKYIIEKREEQ